MIIDWLVYANLLVTQLPQDPYMNFHSVKIVSFNQVVLIKKTIVWWSVTEFYVFCKLVPVM